MIAQAKKVARATDNVVVLDAGASLTRLERKIDPETSRPLLQLVFPTPDREEQTLVVSFLLSLPNLAVPMSEGLVRYCATVAALSRYQRIMELRTGLHTFLMESGNALVSLEELDETFFTGFVAFLNRPGKTGKPLSKNTRANRLGVVRAVLQHLKSDGTWGSAAGRAEEALPLNPWPGRSQTGTPVPRLSSAHMQKIILAAEAEILGTIDRWQKGRRLLRKGNKAIQEGRADYQDRSVCLAALATHFPRFVDDISCLQHIDPPLFRALTSDYDVRDLVGFLYPTSRDLVPFVLLIATATAFNADTAMSLEWGDIYEGERFGLPTIRISGPKARAAEDPVVLLDASPSAAFNIAILLDELRSITARIRPAVNRITSKDKLLLFVTKARATSPVAKTFEHKSGGPSCDAVWKCALRSFIKTHAIDKFNLSQIRFTLLDEVQVQTGDLLAAQELGKQKNPETLWRHYTSDGTKQRYRERIGLILLVRDRWLTTRGVIDPRHKPLTYDVGAATPGFLCLDPFDSPRANQKADRLCTAYGECPACPLAAAEVSQVSNVAQYLGLRTAIFESRGRVSPEAWSTKWKPIADDLESLLKNVSEGVLEQAVTFKIVLPPVG
ncbi:phage integrase SAM-like domain-containing protein [Sphingomonas sp. LY54]|uniref:phage integrase SAM-like domain-containing protein n=1 Tax=Sphingomonas sp. LY54 TaxID=3095343 RepID=UPI002D787206|nr:phage integrase SAM-like domain-containing protein [Sphingomonas sp. LY54]WRP28743.1 phage integrase SAM-like domain-containing protein [Sphingomonas sp. LY54]